MIQTVWKSLLTLIPAIVAGLMAPYDTSCQETPPAATLSMEKILAAASNPKALGDLTDPRAIADPMRTGPYLTAVERVLDKLSPGERRSALRRLILSPNPWLAPLAAGRSIQEGNREDAPLIASRITEWSVESQTGILQLLTPGRVSSPEIQRAVLRQLIKDGEIPKYHDNLADSAASLLAKTRLTEDREMLLKLASLLPTRSAVWEAVAYSGAMDESRATLASKIYRDASIPIPVRVSAAVALQTIDRGAVAFAEAQVESVLSRFAGEGVGPMLESMYREKSSAMANNEEAGFLLGRSEILTALAILNTDSVQDTVFRCVRASNETIRSWCGLVAATRWPDRLLKIGQVNFSAQEYADLLAVLVIKHPEQSAAAEALAGHDRLVEGTARITQTGFLTLQSCGNLALLY